MRHHVDDSDGDDDMVGNRFNLFFFFCYLICFKYYIKHFALIISLHTQNKDNFMNSMRV